jgi:hypothetical protein
MNVLVDYDNLPHSVRARGLVYVAERIVQAALVAGPLSGSRTRFRLYGGWYEGNTLTRRAQTLATEALADFPRIITLGAAAPLVNAEVELAYSLEIDPSRHLLSTYRKQAPAATGCRPPADAGCSRTPCPLVAMHHFLASDTCPEPHCLIEPNHLLFRPQQKLVDTMLAMDVIYLAQHDATSLCIVSSDDDLWPALRTGVLYGKRIIHAHTLPGRVTPGHYSAGCGPLYVQTSL